MTDLPAGVPAPDRIIDGVPCFVGRAPDGARDATVSLMFRAGTADETLPMRGIAHLAEHLVCGDFDLRRYHFNGAVNRCMTAFVVRGTPEEITEHFATLCAAISRPALDRAPHEAKVLQVEASRRQVGTAGDSLWHRIGARNFGTEWYRELFLAHPDPATIGHWIASAMNASNAVLWCRGDLPPDLRLPLAPGAGRWPTPEPTWLPHPYPVWATSRSGSIGLSLIAPESVRNIVAMHVARNRILDRLRSQDAASYAVELDLDGIGATSLQHAVIQADCLAAEAVAARDAFIVEMNRLARLGPTVEEVEFVCDDIVRSLDAEVDDGKAVQRATSALLGRPIWDLRQEWDAAGPIDPDAVRDALYELMQTALWLVPTEVGWRDHRVRPADAWSTDRVSGAAVAIERPVDDEDRRSLVVGPEGVTLIVGSETHLVTVRFDDCAALLRHPDGARSLIGQDASAIRVDPDRWPDGEGLVRYLDGSARRSTIVDLA